MYHSICLTGLLLIVDTIAAWPLFGNAVFHVGNTVTLRSAFYCPQQLLPNFKYLDLTKLWCTIITIASTQRNHHIGFTIRPSNFLTYQHVFVAFGNTNDFLFCVATSCTIGGMFLKSAMDYGIEISEHRDWSLDSLGEWGKPINTETQLSDDRSKPIIALDYDKLTL